MANSVKFGLKNVHYAVMGEDPTTHATTYATPVAIEGAVSLTLDAEGEESNFFADNRKFFKQFANNGYSGDLEIARIPEGFRKDVLGEIDDHGVLIEKSDAVIKSFALAFEIDGDVKKERFWFLNCTVSRPSTEAGTTEDTIEPKTDKLSLVVAADKDGKVRTKTGDEVTDAVYNAWFNAVVTQGPTGAAKVTAKKEN